MRLLDNFLAPWLSKEAPASTSPSYLDLIERGEWAAAAPVLRAATQHNDGVAWGFLGAMHSKGLGVPRDEVEACLCFRQAANHNHAQSQAALGICLARGFGIAQNLDEACFWLMKASKSGIRQGIEALAAIAASHPEIAGKHCSKARLRELVAVLDDAADIAPHSVH